MERMVGTSMKLTSSPSEIVPNPSTGSVYSVTGLFEQRRSVAHQRFQVETRVDGDVLLGDVQQGAQPGRGGSALTQRTDQRDEEGLLAAASIEVGEHRIVAVAALPHERHRLARH